MSDVAAVKSLVTKYNALRQEVAKVIIGQDDVVNQILISIFSGGHALLIGVPGLAKTLMVNTISQALGLDFKRIQFTPDLMPSDILGSEILDESRQFKFIKGPIFANIILADEINRTPPKTQAALLEAMQERAVTVSGHHYKLDLPYFVLATQNPIEQEGTYALPEAQLDRFLFKIDVGYPNLEEEILIIKTHQDRKGVLPQTLIKSLLSEADLLDYKSKIHEILVEEKIMIYIAQLITKTRNHPHLYLGGSPRASIAVLNASKAYAAINGRDFVIPEDIKKVLYPVLRHRIILTPEREMEGMTTDKVIEMIVQSIEVPR